MNIVILIAIGIQYLIARNNRLAAANVGYIITTVILLWGLGVYSKGNYVALGGLELSQGFFIILCIIWYLYDTFAFFNAREERTEAVSFMEQIPGVKTPLSSLENPDRFVHHAIYDSNTKFYLGKLVRVNKEEGKCVIKPDLEDEFSRNMNEVFVIVSETSEVKPTQPVEKSTATLPDKTSTVGDKKSEMATMPLSNEERLILAAKEGDIQTVKALLNAGIDVNATVEGYAGMTPLMHASRSNHIDCVKVLIGAGANVRMKNELGRTALKIAEGNGNREIVKLLEEAGAKEERK